MASETEFVNVRDLREGDYVDLEGDKYADPNNSPFLQSEYVIVAENPKQETENCVAVGFESFDVVGFPSDHMVKRKILTRNSN